MGEKMLRGSDITCPKCGYIITKEERDKAIERQDGCIVYITCLNPDCEHAFSAVVYKIDKSN